MAFLIQKRGIQGDEAANIGAIYPRGTTQITGWKIRVQILILGGGTKLGLNWDCIETGNGLSL